MPAIRSQPPEKDRLATKGPSQLYLASRLSSVKLAAPIVPVQLDLGARVPRLREAQDFHLQVNLWTGGDKDKYRQYIDQQASRDLSGKSPFTLRIEEKLHAYWMEYTNAVERPIDLEKGASPPDRDLILEYLKALSSLGSSEIGSAHDGWSLESVHRALFRFLGTLKTRGVAPLKDVDLGYIMDGLSEAGGKTYASVKTPTVLSNCDYDALMSIIFSSRMQFESNFHRLQFALILLLLKATEVPLEHFVQPLQETGHTHQCIRLENCRLVLERVTEDGPDFSLSITHQCSNEEGRTLCHIIRSLPGSKAHLDPLNLFLALTIRSKVWDEPQGLDLLHLVKKGKNADLSAIAVTLPYSVPLKRDFKLTPLVSATKPEACGKGGPDDAAVLSLSSFNQHLERARKVLGWDESVDIIHALRISEHSVIINGAVGVLPGNDGIDLTEDIDSIVSTHPLIDCVIDYGYPNARSVVVQRYLRLLLHDDIIDANKCPQCFDYSIRDSYYYPNDKEREASTRVKTHRSHDDLIEHIHGCQNERFHMQLRCNFCGLFVSTIEEHGFKAHFETCFSKVGRDLIAKVPRSRTSSSIDKEPLSHEINVFNDSVCKLFFCPFCLIEGTKLEIRNYATYDRRATARHIVEHFRKGKGRLKALQPFTTASNLKCPIPGCGQRGLGAEAAVNHLYIDHGFPLIECTCKDQAHDHSCLDWRLTRNSGTTVYFADVLHRAKRDFYGFN